MAWVLIIFVIFVALSPLLSMRPSRRQRHIADLRQQAAIGGMLVQLQPLPQTTDSGLRPFYSRRRVRQEDQARPSVIYRRTAQGWLSAQQKIAPRVRPLLAAMPAGVSHVSDTDLAVGAFWDENGSEDDLQQIDKLLQAILQGTAGS